MTERKKKKSDVAVHVGCGVSSELKEGEIVALNPNATGNAPYVSVEWQEEEGGSQDFTKKDFTAMLRNGSLTLIAASVHEDIPVDALVDKIVEMKWQPLPSAQTIARIFRVSQYRAGKALKKIGEVRSNG